jgi:hypothetical protein
MHIILCWNERLYATAAWINSIVAGTSFVMKPPAGEEYCLSSLISGVTLFSDFKATDQLGLHALLGLAGAIPTSQLENKAPYKRYWPIGL